jgi:protein-S-isoprenylcysteine O-methyltransferase Ste14
MRLVILALMLGRAFWPPLDHWLIPLWPLWQIPVMLTGDLLLALSFAGVLLVHRQVGDEWRSGMAPDGPARLITNGAYAWVRHPSFSLVLLGQLGLFLAVPSLFTLICLLLGARTLLSQARLEDLQLGTRFGAEFERYATQVPAWPWPWPMPWRSTANYKGGLARKDFIP